MARARRRSGGASVAGTVLYVIILILWILAICVGGLYILKQVWAYASVYDETQPEPVIENYMAYLRQNLWDDNIAATVEAMPHQVQTDEEVGRLVKQMLTEEELTYLLDQTKTRGDRRCYALLCGQNIFGEVYLEEDTSRNLVKDVNLPDQVVGILAKIGVAIQPELYSWRVAEESFDFSGLYSSIRVTVPENYRVSLNGVNLSDEYIVERDIHYDILEQYYYRYDNLPTKVTYQFDHIMGHIEPVIYDEYGNVFVIDETKDDTQYMKQVSPEKLTQIASFIDQFADAYLHMSAGTMEANAAYNQLLPYIEKGSELDEKMKQVMLIGDYSHNSYYQYIGSQVLNAVQLGDLFYLVDFTASASAVQPVGTVEITRNIRAAVDESSGSMLVVAIDDF